MTTLLCRAALAFVCSASCLLSTAVFADESRGEAPVASAAAKVEGKANEAREATESAAPKPAAASAGVKPPAAIAVKPAAAEAKGPRASAETGPAAPASRKPSGRQLRRDQVSKERAVGAAETRTASDIEITARPATPLAHIEITRVPFSMPLHTLGGS